MNKKINIKVCGKWILAGEYAVLRSCPTLAFPLASQFIKLSYQQKAGSTFKIINQGLVKPSADLFSYKYNVKPVLELSKKRKDFYTAHSKHSDHNKHSKHTEYSEKCFTRLFQTVLSQALQNISKTESDLEGTLEINSRIVFGAGLGASAVICASIGKLFYLLKWIKEKDLFYFCHSLENSLHGQSSGVDIAVVLAGKPLLFQRTSSSVKTVPLIQVFKPHWQPRVFLSHSGESRSTKENIKKMKLFWEKEPKKAEALNQQMAKAVLKAKKGLEKPSEAEGFDFLKNSFFLAEDCFLKWNLIGKNMRELISFLKAEGAKAVKPTGSGAGGCVLSLWSDQPPDHIKSYLVSAF